VLNGREQCTLRHAIAAQFVGDEDTRRILQAFQQALEKALCRPCIAAALHQDIQHDAVLIDGAPEVVPHTLDPNEHLIEVPLVTRPGSPPAKIIRKACAELQAPLPDALIGDLYTALSQKQFDISEAQAEYMIQPDRVADKLGREAVAIVRVGRLSHPTILPELLSPAKPR